MISGQPLDTVKVKMQTYPASYPKAIPCFQLILRLDGIRGLYAGLLVQKSFQNREMVEVTK